MFWLRIFTYAGMFVVAFFFVTQILIPAFMNRPLFPLFRKKETDLYSEITELNQQLHEEELKSYASELKEELTSKQVELEVPASEIPVANTSRNKKLGTQQL